MSILNEGAENNLDTIITSYRDNLTYKAKDSDLVAAINKAIEESKTLKEKMDNIGKMNKLYWKVGTNKDLTRLHPKKAKIVNNRIFTDIETAIPILTAEPPEPTIIGQIDNKSRIILETGLEIAYEVKYKIQQKLQQLARQWFMSRMGVWKYRWDKGFTTEVVLTRKIGLDSRATLKDNCEYIYEELEDTIENITAKFPSKKKDIENIFGKDHPKTKIKYLEFWGDNGKWVCWKLRDIILDKKKNPNFDYEDENNNIFNDPQFPYIFLNVFATGDETGMYDETSLVEQAASLQEGATQEKQQILDLNEGQKRVWTASGEAMSAKIFQELINKTGDLGVYMDRKAPVGGLQQVQSGKPDASLFNDVASSLNEVDNTIGIHATTRGKEPERQETLGAQRLQMGADYGRLDLIVRNIEQAMEDWYNAYLHCLKVYSNEPELLSDGERVIELIGQDIPSNIMVMVKKGSTLPTDKQTKMENAIQLAKIDKIDPETMFEELGYDNPEERTQKLYQWLQATGKIQLPQPMPVAGQPGAAQGQGGGDQQKLQQVQRLKELLQKVKQLPPEEQAQAASQIEEVAKNIQ